MNDQCRRRAKGTEGARRDRGHANAALVVALLCTVLIIAVEGLVRRRHDRAVRPETSSCATVRGDFWSPLSGVEYTGRLAIDLPPRAGGGMVLFVADILRLEIEAESPKRAPLPLITDRLSGGPGVGVPPDLWLERGSPWGMPHEVVRVRVDAFADRHRALYMNLGRRAPRVLARLMGYDASARASVCAARLDARAAFLAGHELEITPAQSEYFAMGWYGHDPASGEAVRRMTERGVMLIPSARDGRIHITVEAAPLTPRHRGSGPMLWLRVNDVFETSALPMRDEFASYEWDLPDESWIAGTNELLLTVSTIEMRGSEEVSIQRQPGSEYELALKGVKLRIGDSGIKN